MLIAEVGTEGDGFWPRRGPRPLLAFFPPAEYKRGYYSSLSSPSGALQAGGMEERRRGVNYNGDGLRRIRRGPEGADECFTAARAQEEGPRPPLLSEWLRPPEAD